jgi:CHAT domain
MPRTVPVFDELQIRLTSGSAGTYNVAVSSAAGARANGAFALPFSEVELENFRLTVDPRGGRVRGRSSPQVRRAREFGEALFGALLADAAIRDVYVAAAYDAEKAGRGMRLTLYVGAAPDLAAVPWEFLYRRPGFLAQSVWTPVVRYLDLESPPPALSVEPPLRLLGMVSQPTADGWPALDVELEKAKLEQSLAPLVADGYVELRWLPGSTLRDLQREVAHGDDFHVFHFIGHGEFDDRTGQGSLILGDADGRARHVDGETLGTVLCDRRSVRLAVLNACEGAKASPTDPLAGVAAGLVQHDVPAVVGMQFAISDPAAISFAAELYSGLAQGFPVDVAVTEGRRALATETDLEWATPVLFMRVPDGRLFDMDLTTLTAGAPPRPAATPDSAEAPDEPGDPTAPWSRRTVRWGGIAAALCALALGVLLLFGGGSRSDFPGALADALEPLVAANRGLTGAVLSLDTESSPGDALARYYSAADATTDFDGALRKLPPAGSGDTRLKAESGRLSQYQATYLRYVIAFLTGTQKQRHEEEFGSVSARLVRTLRRLEDLAPGAHESVRGAQRLKQWAAGTLETTPDAPGPGGPADGPGGADGGDGRDQSAPPATKPPQARFAGNVSRTVAPGAAVPVGVTAVDARGRRLPVKCDRDTVTVTNVAVTVTCTAFWRDGRTRSTSFSISPRTAPKGPAPSPTGPIPPATDPPAAKDRPATEGAPTEGTTTEGATSGVRPRPEARPRATATEPSVRPRPRARLAALRASEALEP